MKKIVANLIFTAMLVSLAACGSRTDKDAELTKESAVMESSGVSPVTEAAGAESEKIGSANTEAEEDAENAMEAAVTDSANRVGDGAKLLKKIGARRKEADSESKMV